MTENLAKLYTWLIVHLPRCFHLFKQKVSKNIIKLQSRCRLIMITIYQTLYISIYLDRYMPIIVRVCNIIRYLEGMSKNLFFILIFSLPNICYCVL